MRARRTCRKMPVPGRCRVGDLPEGHVFLTAWTQRVGTVLELKYLAHDLEIVALLDGPDGRSPRERLLSEHVVVDIPRGSAFRPAPDVHGARVWRHWGEA